MAVAGLIAVILDNTIPGTPEERGLTLWRKMASDDGGTAKQNYAPMSIYDLPFGLNRLSSFGFAKYIPCLPYYPKKDRKEVEMEANDVTGSTNAAVDSEMKYQTRL